MGSRGNCLLISLDENTSELKQLAESIGMDVVDIFVQRRKNPDPKYYIGKGKANEIKEYITDYNIDFVIFNSSLKPSQQYNLESYMKIEVYDRTRLILEIFSDRAHSEEARLQVELAKLQYEIPLLRDWIHKARYGERPGFMASGEYEVAQYYEISRKRIKKIKKKLEKISIERDIRRKERRYIGFHLISIVGYTNAGKSSLFNMLAGEEVKVENRLFSTLATTTRKIPELKKPVLLTDTVGLIDNLPHWMIEAFHSTLEEIFLSDIILLLIDISEPVEEIDRKLNTSFDLLTPDLSPSKIVLIINKIDKLYKYNNNNKNIHINCNIINKYPSIDKMTDQVKKRYGVDKFVVISAIDNSYRESVVESILDNLEYPIPLEIILPNVSEVQSFINWLYENTDILLIDYKEQVRIRIRCRDRDRGKVLQKCGELKGQVI